MTPPIPLCIAVEDAVFESLAIKILRSLPVEYATQTIYNRGGSGYLKRTIRGFNNAAKGMPFLIGTDLDQYECPPELIADWLTPPKEHNLLILVAVHEAESWVLADRDGFATFLGIDVEKMPVDVEGLEDPKATLIKLARLSRRRQIRDDICPPANSTRVVGPNYNARLGSFVSTSWNPNLARTNSGSLARAMDRLADFRPQWPNEFV